MDFWTYMLRCSDGRFYVGHTDNIKQRVAQHQSGSMPGYTQNKTPVELVWSESFAEREQAFAAERKLKGWSRAKKKALTAGDIERISQLSKNHPFDQPLRQAQRPLRMNGL